MLFSICLLMQALTSPKSTLLELSQIPPSLSCKNIQSTPLFLLSTLPPCSPSIPLLPPLFLDLSLLPPQPLMLQQCSDSSGSIPLLLSHPTASELPTRPTKHLLFHSPLPKGKGVKQALAWNRERLLDLRRLWELCRQHRVSAGLIPMTQPPPTISDTALGVENRINTVTAIPLSSQTPHSTSLLESHCGPPFSPTVWRGLTSIVCKPQRWQVASSMPSKTTKILLQFCCPTTTVTKSPASLPRASGTTKLLLPKGWVYKPEEVRTAVKAKVADPAQYLTLDALLTRSKCKALNPQTTIFPSPCGL
jgi:hypothetical protein